MSSRLIDIAPSILNADLSRLGAEVEAAERGGASIIHVDVMDGRFVPNITMGLPIVKSLARTTKLPLDAHLMIIEPGQYAEQFVDAGAQMVSVHVEADAHLQRTLTGIRNRGAKAGVAINPGTSLVVLEEALPFADYVVLLTVNPGFGGQKFIQTALDKLRRLRRMIDERGFPTRIEIDGGVNLGNIAEVVAAGGEIMVTGTAVFGEEDRAQAVRRLRDATLP